MANDMDMVRAEVPAELKAQLRSILALERMTLTQWLIDQMTRTVADYKVARGERE
jgi:hypothetical protein